MHESREHKIRDRAHRLWEAEGRPEGRGHEHWLEAERQVLAEEETGTLPDGPAVDPLRNPDLIPPGEDLIRPAVTSPEMPSQPSPQPEIPTPPGAPDIPPEIPAPPAAPEPEAPAAAKRKKTAEKSKAAAKSKAGADKPKASGRGKGRGGAEAPP